MNLNEKEKMIKGLMYNPYDKELEIEKLKARQLIFKFNNSMNLKERDLIIKQLFGSIGDNCFIEPTLRVDFGSNINIGNNFYANFGTVFLDTCPITIGNNCMIGPNVNFMTVTHPIDPIERNSGLEFGKPIKIGNNCWIGGGSSILPGVTLGNNVVVGAGTTVCKSFGDNVVIVGNPSRILKEIPIK